MKICIVEKDFSMLYPVEHHKSFIWTDRYDTPGDFEIYIPIATVSREHLKIDNYISCDMSEHLMIIEDIKTESDLDNGNFLIVTGKSLESIPSRRIIWYPITFTDEPLQNVIKTLLEKNIISPEDTSRAIPNFIFEESTDERITSIDKVTVSYVIGDNLGDIIEDLCKTYQLGYKIIPNDDNQFIFSLFAGTDRSYAQETNPWIIFSPNQDNIISSRFNESTSNYKNVTLVINEKTTYDEANPEGVTERSGLVLGSTAGLSRRETFTDASGIDTDEETTQHDLLANMRVEGYKTLAEYKYDKDFDGEIDYIRSYQYGTDFYIGDIVEIQDLFGNEGRERVTEYMIKEDTNGFAAYPTLTSVVEDTAGGGYSYELKLGTEHENAFYGDWGYEAYNHAHTTGNPHNTTWSDVGADELGAADKAYERAKSDAQTIGNSALRNANTYTDNQIKKLKDLTAKDWQPGIDSAVLAGVTEAKTYTDAKSAENEVYTDQEVEKAKTYTDAKSAENEVYTDQEVEKAKNELTDYTDSKSSDDRKYADSLIKDLVGQAPEELNTIYELAQAIRNTSVTDALNKAIIGKVSKSGDTMTGQLKNSLSGNWTGIANGRALLEGTAATNSNAVGLIAGKSRNGKFVDWICNLDRGITYYTNANISAGGSARTHEITLLNESGQTILKDLTVNNAICGKRYLQSSSCVYIYGNISSSDGGKTISLGGNLSDYDITKDDDVLAVWKKLPNVCQAFIKNNSQGGPKYHDSLPSKGDTSTTLFIRENARGLIINCDNKSNLAWTSVHGNEIVGWNSFKDLKNSVSNGKTLVANAITAKGVQTATNADFATMAANISKLTSSLTGTFHYRESTGVANGDGMAVLVYDTGDRASLLVNGIEKASSTTTSGWFFMNPRLVVTFKKGDTVSIGGNANTLFIMIEVY